MNLQKAIEKQKRLLSNKAFNSGIYENFGQIEIQKLKDKYIDSSKYTPEMNNNRDLLSIFDSWCSHYTIKRGC